MTLDDLYERHFYASPTLYVSYILVCDIKILVTRVVAVMVLCILESSGPHKISGGKLQIVERVMEGTYYGWAHMYLTMVWCLLNHARTVGGDLCFPSFI